MEESGEWSTFKRGDRKGGTNLPILYHIKPYMSSMFYMLHNTANSHICQVFVPNNETK
jgi:hypothetical protein